MKKLLTLVIAVVLGMSALFANPVDVNTAKSLGQKFVQANFEKTMRAGLDLYYTVTSDNGQPCVYVFNIGNEGFVMVAASDNVRPILAYSENGPFDATNPYNGAMFMLETYKNSISYAIEKNINPTPEIAGQWESLNNCGKLSNKRAHTVGPLVQTKWNQNSPYNLYAPPSSAAGAPGGRCYAGCVATAMSQVMKYWDHPIQGEGSHSYYCPGYGQQSANFGATTYQWDLMPRTLSGASQEEIEAVATLMYHCGVSVNMSFAPDGSGAYSQDVPGAMANYFDYDYCVQKQRNSYSLTNWVNLLKAEFDLGRPVYYSGHSSAGGHAFVADGYNEDDFISFNFGWSGSDDDWYAVDAIEYNQSAAAIFNYVPSAVYQNTVQAPTNVTATKAGELAQQATITWTNPTKTMSNQTVSSLDQIVVAREGKIIYTADNPTPGASMSFVDENVPCYSTFEYRVYAVKEGVNGVAGSATESFGPTCEWKIIATSSSMQGWKSGYIVAYDGAGGEIDRFTMTSSNPTTYNIQMTLGKVYFGWKAGSENVSLTYKIKDATGAVVCQYEGNSSDIPEGIFYSANNGCGNTAPSSVPTNLHATTDGDNIVLTWDGTAKDNYGFNIYRDGLLCELAHSNEFVDEAPAIGGHCYQVCVLGEGGESELSNEACGTAGEGCDAAKNEWYYIQSNGKPAITWELPDNTEGLEAFFIYRKVNEDDEYERIKIVAPNKTEYKETKALEFGNWYYYRVVAYYKAIECYSAPAKAMYNNDYFVKIYYSQDGVDESMAQGIEMYPNPVKDILTVKAEGLSNVIVYNSVGQKVFEQNVDAEETTISTSNFEAGIYMVRIIANGNEVTRKISVVK
jgi:hypothetical protein